jgi:hypothetical protein
VGFILSFALLRYFALTRVNVESGIGGRLFASNAWGTFLGLVCFSLSGGVLGLLFRSILRAWRWNGIIAGAALGIAFWFLSSMLIGTFPTLDFFTPSGTAPIGPMGVFGGQLTFYSLLFAQAAYGGLIGWCLPQVSPADASASKTLTLSLHRPV